MAYKDLREFIARLEREGELKRIAAAVDVDLEITEITNRVSKGGGPALYVERPRAARGPAAATSGATGCRCTTSGPRPCTGRSTRAAPSTSAGSRARAGGTRARERGWTLPPPWARTR